MKKKNTVSQLKKALWRVFTIYIKNRDKWTCITCGKTGEGQGMNTGHYIAKAACNPKYYFSEQNCNAQCFQCNLMLEGNRPVYRQRIIQKYGNEVLLDLETQYNSSIVWTTKEYEDKIAYYTAKIK